MERSDAMLQRPPPTPPHPLPSSSAPRAGRRSLLLHPPRDGDGRLLLTSSAPLSPSLAFEGFSELQPGIHSLRFAAPLGGGAGAAAACTYALHDWATPAVRQLARFWRAPELVHPPAPQVTVVAAAELVAVQGAAGVGAAAAAAAVGGREAAAPEEGPAFQATVDAVLGALRHAVATRCRCIDERPESPSTAVPPPAAARPQLLLPAAPVLILFSGGVDSTLLAALAHEALPPGAPIDLASVCFDSGRSPDRLAALDALAELRQLAPTRRWRLLQASAVLPPC